MYRLILESLLGVRLEGDHLRIAPAMPRDWTSFEIDYRYRNTLYQIEVRQQEADTGVGSVTVDGVERDDSRIPLHDDGQEHRVLVRVSRPFGTG